MHVREPLCVHTAASDWSMVFASSCMGSRPGRACINVRITLGLVLLVQSKSNNFQEAREGVERLIKAFENRQNTMECLHGLPASSTVTQKGTFCFCGENPSCEFFSWKPDEDPLEPHGTGLFTMPPSYRYTVKKTGETFTSHETDRKEAYGLW